MGAALRLAHRGDWRVAPENSLAAMEAALRIPACDGLEFDVRSSADGVAVLLHDETLARVQQVPAACVTLTAAELATHGIPTLAEVLRAAGPDRFLDVEFKALVPDAIGTLERARGRSTDGGATSLRNAVVSAFEPETLTWLATERPGWPRWLNAYDLHPETIARAADLGCEAIAADWQAIDADGVARAAAAGLAVAAWTVRQAADYDRLVELGVVAICAEAAALDG